MIGSVTFNLPSGGIARFRLDSIRNMSTDGSGVLILNVASQTIGSSGTTYSEFDFTCVDEGAAQRVLNYITTLQDAQAVGVFVIDSSVNYVTATITRPFIIYEPANNKWYVYADGFNMRPAASINFAGSNIAIDTDNSSDAQVQSVRLPGQPAFGTYTIQLVDIGGKVIVTSDAMVFSVAAITCNPAPAGGSITCTVNGSDGLVGGTGATIDLALFPELTPDFSYATTAVAAGQLTFVDDDSAGTPVVVFYSQSGTIVSNYIKM